MRATYKLNVAAVARPKEAPAREATTRQLFFRGKPLRFYHVVLICCEQERTTMRKDMSKVIVERPRLGGKHVRKGRAVDEDLQLSKQGMRKPYLKGYNYKELNENLAPLLRFLESRVGRIWNDVYSEICANIRVTNTVQEHIRVHVDQFVAQHVRLHDDGTLWDYDGRPRPLASWDRFYVDPTNGVLRKNTVRSEWDIRRQRRRDEEAAERAKTQRSLSGGVELRKKDGIWYQVDIVPVPEIVKHETVRNDGTVRVIESGGTAYDVILGQTVGTRSGWQITRASHYARTKRQLSSAELKRYGVAND